MANNGSDCSDDLHSCFFCNMEKELLLQRPPVIISKGKRHFYLPLVSGSHYICISCLSLEVNALGHSVDFCEYD